MTEVRFSETHVSKSLLNVGRLSGGAFLRNARVNVLLNVGPCAKERRTSTSGTP